MARPQRPVEPSPPQDNRKHHAHKDHTARRPAPPAETTPKHKAPKKKPPPRKRGPRKFGGHNTAKMGNVEAKLIHAHGQGVLAQKDNDDKGSNHYLNKVRGNGGTNVKTTAANVVAGLSSVSGNNKIGQFMNGNDNLNNVSNSVSDTRDGSNILMAAANTVGQGRQINGTNGINQSANNNNGTDYFRNQ